MSKDSFLLDDLVTMQYVVGYQLPIHPTDYQVKISPSKGEHTMTMVSSYNVTRTEGCGIPFNCLAPLGQKWKQVVDQFNVNEEDSSITLQSTNAFSGLISCVEKGKVFSAVKSVSIQPYLILVNPKEVFVLSPIPGSPDDDHKTSIEDAITRSKSCPQKLRIQYP